MKFVIAAALFASASALSEDASAYLLGERFQAFKTKHGKVYSAEEEPIRMKHFEAFVEKVTAKNAKLVAMGLEPIHGITRFADLSEDEFQFFLGVDASLPAAKAPVWEAPAGLNATLSGSFNWATTGKTTPVKDQEQCGSCWAFSATETIESAWARAGNPLTSFSPQQIVSCDKTDSGCNGGLPTNAFEYVKSAGGLTSDSAYPYTSGTGNTGTCKSPLPALVGGTVSKWAYSSTPCQGFTACTENAAAQAAALQANGPMSVALDASEWSSYTGGVMTSASCSSSPRKMDHAVQLVGYNADAATPYWIVRNSWNTNWGENGYIYLAMNSNTCGLFNLPAQVTAI